MRVLVMTVVHRPLDARIHAREIRALVDRGHQVSYAAPWSATDTDTSLAGAGVVPIDLPRSSGRRRLEAIKAARAVVRAHGTHHDVILLHDPELLLAVAGLDVLRQRVVVWDVHEDTAAALLDKPWLPRLLRPGAAVLVKAAERWAERNLQLLLAEHAYAKRFQGFHPVVPNTPLVPDAPPRPPDRPPRVVCVGRQSILRGVLDIIELAKRLAGDVEVHLIGPADPEIRPVVEHANANGWLHWHGFLPNDRALALVEGAAAGLSLLHDVPNYRVSMPTKVLEYLGRAVPVVTTPLPEPARIVSEADCGVVVPFQDPAAAADAVRALAFDPSGCRSAGLRGYARVREAHSWNRDGPAFVNALEHWVAAGEAGSRGC